MTEAKRGERRKARTGSRGLSLHDYRLLAEFRHLLARFLAFSEAAAGESGLQPRQHQALLAIKGYPGGSGVTVGDLAERLCIRHHSAVGLVDRLAAGGYIRRAADTEDKRRVLLTLTDRGEETLAGLSAVHREELRRLMPLLKPLLTRLAARSRHS